MFRTILLILLLTVLSISTVRSHVIAQTFNGSTINLLSAVEIIYMGSQNERTSEEIILEATINQQDVAGKIYIMHNILNGDEIIAQMQSQGALAIIEIAAKYFTSGYMRYQFMDREAVTSINIPIFEITLEESALIWPLLEEGTIANFTLIPGGSTNPWDIVLLTPGYYVYTAILMAFSLTNMGLGIWKLTIFIKFYGGIVASISQLALAMEILANLLRIVGCVDAFGVHNIYTELTKGIFHHISIPIAVSSVMLFTLYWHEIMTTSAISLHPFLVKTRLAFGGIVAMCLSSELVVILLRAFSVTSNDFTNFYLITAYIYLVVGVGLFGFYLQTGIQLLKRLKKSQRQGRKIKHLKATTIKILVTAGCILGLVTIAALFASPLLYTSMGYFAGWYTLFLFLNCTSMMNILAFGIPSRGKTASGGSSGKKTANTTSPRTRSSANAAVADTTSQV